MITFRTRGQFEVDWTNISIDGEADEEIAAIIANRLGQREYEILVSRDSGEFFSLGEDPQGWV